ncbi:MAG TPA: nicotinate-nucleotide adenylyltransferase [Nitrospirae bacterium]|nr:nicotinate-nucleotide adenylyltransferase [Nitrospirota bacterium]HDZ84722.1 nicotinate-nucleotide adenylyltransferase [Nitrospirota bacterium]
MRIGICGGTFNPIHYGHLRTAEETAEMLSLDRVIFMPSGITPFDKPDLVSARSRYKMVKAAIEENPIFSISSIEVKTRGRSYTVDTLMRLRNRYKKSELFFIIGMDAFLDLPEWKGPDRIVRTANMIIISRPGSSFYGLRSSPYLEGVPERVLKDLDKGKIEMFEFDISMTQKGYLCNVTGLDISASKIRKLIMSGKEVTYLLPDSVKSYIISNDLYHGHKIRTNR